MGEKSPNTAKILLDDFALNLSESTTNARDFGRDLRKSIDLLKSMVEHLGSADALSRLVVIEQQIQTVERDLKKLESELTKVKKIINSFNELKFTIIGIFLCISFILNYLLGMIKGVW